MYILVTPFKTYFIPYFLSIQFALASVSLMPNLAMNNLAMKRTTPAVGKLYRSAWKKQQENARKTPWVYLLQR